jgi:hypothetical protein
MSNQLPDRDQLEQIGAVLKEAGADGLNALGHAAKAFAAGEFNVDTCRAWVEVQRCDRKSQIFLPDAMGGIPDPQDEHSTGEANRRTPNPFTKDHWNITEQGRLTKANPKMAAALASAAGVKIGATKPRAA